MHIFIYKNLFAFQIFSLGEFLGVELLVKENEH